MVTAGSVDMTILKVKFGSDIRKSTLRHNNDLTFNDLYLMVQRVFQISPKQSFILKYKDADGDLVTLADDSDVLFAVQSEQNLNVEILLDNPAVRSVASIQEQLGSLQVAIERLSASLASVDAGNGGEVAHSVSYSMCNQVNGDVVSHHPDVDRPVTAPSPSLSHSNAAPPPATIQPSLHEQVLPDGGQLQHHNTTGSEVPSAIDEDIPLGAEAIPDNMPPQYPPFPGQQKHQHQDHHFQPEQHHDHCHQEHAPPQFQAPPTSIPSFPNSQAPPPPPSQVSGFAPSHVSEPAPPAPYHEQQQQQFAPPPPAGPAHPEVPPQQQQQQFAPPPQFGQGPPPPHMQQQQGGPPQFAPPPNFGGPGAPQHPGSPFGSSVASTPVPHQQPPQFAPPQQHPQAPSPPNYGGQQQPPQQQQHGMPPQGGPPPPQFAPPGQFPPPGGVAPPPPGAPNFQQGFQPQGPPTGQPSQPQFAPPPSFAPPGGAPPPSFPPGGAPPPSFPPMGGAPGANPFARAPGGPGAYRQSPYQQ